MRGTLVGYRLINLKIISLIIGLLSFFAYLFDFPFHIDIKLLNLFLLIFIVLPIFLFGGINLKYRKIGYIDLDETSITLHLNNDLKREFQLSKETFIKIHLEAVEKQLSSKLYLFRIIIENDNTKNIYYFTIPEKYIERLKNVFRNWYLHKFNFREFSKSGTKMFLLNSNLSYSDIQEIKNKYNLSL